ncbi:MAG: carbohydrate kinase family protein [Anaerolineaceae bacterium]|nr:carbohydrate kinase family protein [Anaerolineaceae bacterium]
MKYDVLVIGGYFLDFIFAELEDSPGLGREVFSKQFFMLPGGSYNTVATLHRLGVKAAWAVKFGNDEFSQYVIKAAENDGLDASCFSYEKRPIRNITVSASLQGDREFISYSDPQRLGLEFVKKIMDVSSRVMFISGLYSGRLLQLAKRHCCKHGTVMIMDGNSSIGTVSDKQIARSLNEVDIFIPNASEARRLTGCTEMADCLSILGDFTKLVVVKDGKNGSYAIHDGTIHHVEAITIRKCVDTTGAGDCFDAGFIKAYLDELDIDACLMWGNVVGGLSTQGFGGTDYKISLEEVQKYLKNFPRKIRLGGTA